MAHEEELKNILRDLSKERKDSDEAIFKAIRILLTRVPIKEFEKRYYKWKEEDGA